MSSQPMNTVPLRRRRVQVSADNSSEPSVSDESALVATSTADDSTLASDHDSDSDSELSESSEEPSSESSSEDEQDETSDVEMTEHQGEDGVVNLMANRGKKPIMKLNQEELGPDIRTFLKEFLPQLKAANEELEAQRQAGTLKRLEINDDEEGNSEQHIEMDLGLGVLEDKDPNATQTSSSERDASDSEDDSQEKDVLGKLMGRKKAQNVVPVQEVQEPRPS